MPHANDQLFRHATEIAERRIRTARKQQSLELARIVGCALAWLVSRAEAATTATANRQ